MNTTTTVLFRLRILSLVPGLADHVDHSFGSYVSSVKNRTVRGGDRESAARYPSGAVAMEAQAQCAASNIPTSIVASLA